MRTLYIFCVSLYLFLSFSTMCLAGFKQTSMSNLKVVGNQIMNGNNEVVIIRGVNRPGTEYSCVQYNTIFDGPSDQASIDSMQSWKINAVRVPLNEDCWLGTGGANASVSGTVYQNAITKYITALTDSGLAVIADLHWTSTSPTSLATQETPMPDAALAPLFWQSVASTFKSNLAVLFDIYNEPYPDDNAWDSPAAWTCWQTGNDCSLPYQVAGMQSLVNAVRGTGAQNIIVVSGIQYATSLVHWLDYVPNDPTGNIAAGVHVYDFNLCRSRGCWDIYWKPVMAKVPLIASEAGETDCESDFLNDFMNYGDTYGVHYLPWAWLPTVCSSPSLITDYDGTPTNFGNGLKVHLSQLASDDVPTFYFTFPVFQDTISYHMDNWSPMDTIVAFNETQIVHSGTYSIRYTPTTSGDLYFMCWACINTTIHRGIEFYVNGGSVGNQEVGIMLTVIPDLSLVASGQSTTNPGPFVMISNITETGALPANQWVKAYLDLSTVAPGVYDGIQIISLDGTQTPIYIDDMIVYDKNHNSANSLQVVSWVLFLVTLSTLFLGL